MMTPFEVGVADVKIRRAAVLGSAVALQARVRPSQLAEDALRLADPGLSRLGQLKESLQRHRLFALAVLAAAGWLAEKARPRNGGRRDTAGRNRASTPRKPEGERK